MKSKFKVGQRIKSGEVEGHVVIVFYPLKSGRDTFVYYCSMYPGADSNYEYVSVVDLNCCGIDNEGKVNTLQALNIYTEDQLELVTEEV